MAANFKTLVASVVSTAFVPDRRKTLFATGAKSTFVDLPSPRHGIVQKAYTISLNATSVASLR